MQVFQECRVIERLDLPGEGRGDTPKTDFKNFKHRFAAGLKGSSTRIRSLSVLNLGPSPASLSGLLPRSGVLTAS